MTAHVGDFGIAKMLVGHKSSTLTSTLGTTRYIVPEFGAAGKVSTKADVYSYGILLLEIMLQKAIFWSKMTETLRNEMLVMIMETGLSCSRKSPTERVDMKEVVARLKMIPWKASPVEE
ncbi:LRR receptor kinase SERK2-like [Nymphaea colorata]|nr:LRR receptor kinase SERK2-like [Nymphaea colorata]